MRAVNLRSENKGLAEAETGRRQSSCPNQKDRSRPDRESSREVGPSTAPPFPYKTRRQEGRKDDGRKGHPPGRPRHGPASSCGKTIP